jgi:hypothetical protein
MHHLQQTPRYKLPRILIERNFIKTNEEKARWQAVQQKAGEIKGTNQARTVIESIQLLLETHTQSELNDKLVELNLADTFSGWSHGDLIDLLNSISR